MQSSGRFLLILAAIVFVRSACLPAACGQDDRKPDRAFDSLAALDAYYDEQLDQLERHRIADLDALASAKSGTEAVQAYRELFHRALDHERFHAAEAAAERCLAGPQTPPDFRSLATLVTVIARAERGDPEGALDRLRAFVRQPGEPSEDDPVLGLGEALLQRLIRSRRYELAAKACTLLGSEVHVALVKAHFEARLRALRLVGAMAPPLVGTDVEGRPFAPAGLKGKVVLVHFWATWCPPSVAAFRRLSALEARLADRGFAVVGVNVDAHHEDVPDVKSALLGVRHVLVEHGVTWPNLLNDEGKGDLARAFGVETIPENFLIGRDGKVVGFELAESELEGAIEKALAVVSSGQPGSPASSSTRR
jgi:thiol-disulfide isomerase/thioredoxin